MLVQLRQSVVARCPQWMRNNDSEFRVRIYFVMCEKKRKNKDCVGGFGGGRERMKVMGEVLLITLPFLLMK